MNTLTIRPFAAAKIGTFLALVLLNSCNIAGIAGNGHVVTEDRAVSNFTEIEASGAFRIEWTNGPASLKITTDKNLLRYVKTYVDGNKLRIRSTESLRPSNHLEVIISSPVLTGARITGAVRLTAAKISGKGFYLDATGATRVHLEGNVPEIVAEMSGASRLEAEELQTKTAELSISGAGRADVSPSDSLKVQISGAGKVTYSGNPTIQRDITGAGSVRHRD